MCQCRNKSIEAEAEAGVVGTREREEKEKERGVLLVNSLAVHIERAREAEEGSSSAQDK